MRSSTKERDIGRDSGSERRAITVTTPTRALAGGEGTALPRPPERLQGCLPIGALGADDRCSDRDPPARGRLRPFLEGQNSASELACLFSSPNPPIASSCCETPIRVQIHNQHYCDPAAMRGWEGSGVSNARFVLRQPRSIATGRDANPNRTGRIMILRRNAAHGGPNLFSADQAPFPAFGVWANP